MTDSMQSVQYTRRPLSDGILQPHGSFLRKNFTRSQSVWTLPSPPPKSLTSRSISRSNSSGSSWSLSETSTSSSGTGNGIIRRFRKRGKSTSPKVEGLRFSFTPTLSGDIDAVDSQGRSLLFYAVRYGQEEPTRLLLDVGCFVNQQDNQGLTPLHEAIGKGQLDIARILLEEGQADANICDHTGMTSLHVAVTLGQVEAVRLLHKHGANINQCDAAGKSPLCLALTGSWNDVTQFLLDKQCDITTSSSNETTCLRLAAQNCKIDVCEVAKRLFKTDYDFKQDCDWLSSDTGLDSTLLDSKVYNKILERAGLKSKSRKKSFLSSGKKKIAKIYKAF